VKISGFELKEGPDMNFLVAFHRPVKLETAPFFCILSEKFTERSIKTLPYSRKKHGTSRNNLHNYTEWGYLSYGHETMDMLKKFSEAGSFIRDCVHLDHQI
jgi:hypothetical protein